MPHPPIPPNCPYFRVYNPCAKPHTYCFVPNQTKMSAWVLGAKLDEYRKLIVASVARCAWLDIAQVAYDRQPWSDPNRDETCKEAISFSAAWAEWGKAHGRPKAD